MRSMRSTRSLLVRRGAALAAGAALLAAGCAKDARLAITEPPAATNAPYLVRAVWLGDSYPMGIQAAGISEATQRSAFPALIARAAGVPYAAPYLAGGACAPYTDYLNAFLAATGQATARLPGQTCGRTPASAGLELLNNVAVSGANSAQPARLAGSGESAALGVFALGGRTQVEAALAMDPTFLSLWVNNDALQAALRGDTSAAFLTPAATFQSNIDTTLARLAAGAPDAKGLLVGVIDPTNVASLIPAAAIVGDSAYRAMLQRAFFGGRPIVNLNCAPGTTALISFATILQLAALPSATLPVIPLACSQFTLTGQTFGTAGVLDAAERAAVTARVAAYNTYLRSKAASLNWAYYDPNTTITRLRASGAINPAPLFLNPATGLPNANPWGSALSLDSFHTSASGQVEIANDIIRVLNQFYGSSIPLATIGPI